MANRYETAELIPTNCVAVTDLTGNIGMPRGWLVGRYDSKGFIDKQRWFTTREAAEQYADTI